MVSDVVQPMSCWWAAAAADMYVDADAGDGCWWWWWRQVRRRHGDAGSEVWDKAENHREEPANTWRHGEGLSELINYTPVDVVLIYSGNFSFMWLGDVIVCTLFLWSRCCVLCVSHPFSWHTMTGRVVYTCLCHQAVSFVSVMYVVWKVTLGLADSNGILLPGLQLTYLCGWQPRDWIRCSAIVHVNYEFMYRIGSYLSADCWTRDCCKNWSGGFSTCWLVVFGRMHGSSYEEMRNCFSSVSF